MAVYRILRLRSRLWHLIYCLKRCSVSLCCCVLGFVCLAISVSCFTYVFRNELFDSFGRCSEVESHDYISNYCQLYKEGKINGSLCRPLCVTHEVSFNSCTNFHAGKRVDIMTCSDYCIREKTVTAALKSPVDSVPNLELLNDNLGVVPFEMGDEVLTTENYLDKLIRRMLKWELGFAAVPSDADAIEMIWEKDYKEFMHSQRDKTVAFQTVLLLLDQTEYKLMKALESSKIVPGIYGTCGPLYLQEFCPPTVFEQPLLQSFDKTQIIPLWQERASATWKLLNLLKRLDTEFPEMLHLCDVKGGNFGVCGDGSVKIIDADSLFFHSRLMETMNSTRCQEHANCNFFDCHGWCKVGEEICHLMVTNNNFQAVCDHVLASKFPHFLGWGSLLGDTPASVYRSLNRAINECLQQTSLVDDKIPIYKPSVSVLSSMQELLQKSLADAA